MTGLVRAVRLNKRDELQLKPVFATAATTGGLHDRRHGGESQLADSRRYALMPSVAHARSGLAVVVRGLVHFACLQSFCRSTTDIHSVMLAEERFSVCSACSNNCKDACTGQQACQTCLLLFLRLVICVCAELKLLDLVLSHRASPCGRCCRKKQYHRCTCASGSLLCPVSAELLEVPMHTHIQLDGHGITI